MEFQNRHNEKIEEIRKSIEQVLEVDLEIKRKSFSKEEFNQVYFCKIIDNIEFLYQRTQAVLYHTKIDLIDYEENFYEIIEMLLEMNFSQEEMEIINYYLFGRFNDDGTTNTLIDKRTNDVIILESSEDLWNVLEDMKKI